MPEFYMLDQQHRTAFEHFLYPGHREEEDLHVLGAAEGRLAVGALAVSETGNGGALLRSVAVAPSWQGRGLALGMLEKMRRVLPETGCERVSAALAPELPGREKVGALLEKAGFLPAEGPEIGEFPLSAFLESSVLKPFLGKKHPGVVPLNQVPSVALKRLNAELMQGGYLSLPLDWERFTPTLSFFGMPDGTNVTCCICLRRREGGAFVEWAYARPASARTLMEAIAMAVSATEEACGPEARCGAVLTNSAAAGLLEKLAGSRLKKTAVARYEMEL